MSIFTKTVIFEKRMPLGEKHRNLPEFPSAGIDFRTGNPYNKAEFKGKGGDGVKLLLQIGMIFGIYWVSQGIEAVLPFPFPASVISMILLLVLLLLRIVRVGQIQELADFMLGNLNFFFVPAAVGVLNHVDLILGNAAAFLTICVVSMVLGFAATVWTVRLTRRWLSGREGGAE